MCEHSEQIARLHDGELSAADRAAMTSHLAGCDSCAAELAALQSLSAQLLAVRPAGLSRIERHRIAANVHAKLDQQRVVRFARWLGGAAAAVLVVGSAGLMVMERAASAASPQPQAAPPWVAVAMASDANASVSPDRQTPAATWYLADASREMP